MSSESVAECHRNQWPNVTGFCNEWRAILYDKAGVEIIENKFHVDCISKIILGCNIEKKYEDILHDICRKKGLNLSKMRLDEKEYKSVS